MYQLWIGNSNIESLNQKYAARARKWATTPERKKLIGYSAEHRERNGLSSFDLYIVEKYFKLIQKIDSFVSTENVDKSTPLTQWEALKEGLSSGSLDYLEAFLDHNSHDTAKKAYLVRVLDEMLRLIDNNTARRSAGDGENPFQALYREAFDRIERATLDIPPPEDAMNDLHVFTVIGNHPDEVSDQPMPEGTIVDPVAVHLKVSWNPS